MSIAMGRTLAAIGIYSPGPASHGVTWDLGKVVTRVDSGLGTRQHVPSSQAMPQGDHIKTAYCSSTQQ